MKNSDIWKNNLHEIRRQKKKSSNVFFLIIFLKKVHSFVIAMSLFLSGVNVQNVGVCQRSKNMPLIYFGRKS